MKDVQQVENCGEKHSQSESECIYLLYLSICLSLCLYLYLSVCKYSYIIYIYIYAQYCISMILHIAAHFRTEPRRAYQWPAEFCALSSAGHAPSQLNSVSGTFHETVSQYSPHMA